jgi:hypothetical protein
MLDVDYTNPAGLIEAEKKIDFFERKRDEELSRRESLLDSLQKSVSEITTNPHRRRRSANRDTFVTWRRGG